MKRAFQSTILRHRSFHDRHPFFSASFGSPSSSPNIQRVYSLPVTYIKVLASPLNHSAVMTSNHPSSLMLNLPSLPVANAYATRFSRCGRACIPSSTDGAAKRRPPWPTTGLRNGKGSPGRRGILEGLFPSHGLSRTTASSRPPAPPPKLPRRPWTPTASSPSQRWVSGVRW